MDEIQKSWKINSDYLKQGISIIAVRDKSDSKHVAKSPYWGWKKYQEEIITEAELFQQMEKCDTTATAFVMGRVSGNFEGIDIDEKNWIGISVMFFEQIEKLMPSVWGKLRIHKSPSGGRHILYRISDHEPEGNKKLAWKEGMKEAAIETRGEGGILLNDSCLNYSAEFDRPIPTITWIERCSLFAIAMGFNQKVKVEAIKPKKEQSDFYDENPFEDYNGKDGGAILSEYGWKVLSDNSKYIYYTRPGKTEGISASFNKETNIYFVFTSSSEFEPSVGYFPSMVLSKLQFNNDNKAVYQYLVEKGYGNINRNKELKFAEQYAKKKQPLPNNFSEDAKAKYEEVTHKIEEAYPFGVFIKPNPEDEKLKMEVSREDLYRISGELGFRFYEETDTIVRIEEHVVRKCSEREYFDEMKEYIKADDPDEQIMLFNIWEKFIQKNGSFSMTRLPLFDVELLTKDDRQNCFRFYRNGFLHITSSIIEFKDYAEFDMLVFKEKIHDRDWVETDKTGIYGEYLENAVGYNKYTLSIIGFLVHDFKNSSTGFIPVLTEQCENPEDGGGSGKNVFCSLLAYATTFVNKNCAGVKYDEKFFQVWTGQRIMALSDLPEHFDFGFIKDAATGSLLHKRLFKDEVEVPVERTPKIVCQTNYSVENVDGGIKRRIRMLEFTDFYTIAGGIDEHHGKHFPEDWTTDDWNGFDNVIANSVQTYLQNNCKINKPEITEGGWIKRFKQTYGPTIADIMHIYFKGWVEKGKVTKDDFNKDLNEYYSDNGTQKKYEVSSLKMNKALEEYCKHHDVKFNKEHQWSENNIKMKGKLFGAEMEGFNEEDGIKEYKSDDHPF